MRGPRLPTDQPRRDDIEAAVAAHNAADREPGLPPAAVRLLATMFADADVSQCSVAHLMAVTSDRRRAISRLLVLLMEAGFLSKEQSRGRIANTYRLHLPPRSQP